MGLSQRLSGETAAKTCLLHCVVRRSLHLRTWSHCGSGVSKCEILHKLKKSVKSVIATFAQQKTPVTHI